MDVITTATMAEWTAVIGGCDGHDSRTHLLSSE
jgi:hypothetical protein